MRESSHPPAGPPLAGLRDRIAALSGPDAAPSSRIATGHAGIDAALGGGLAAGRLHEVFAACADEAASAAGFAAMLALRAGHAAGEQALLWLRCDDAERRAGGLYAPGFAELGGDPDALLLALAPDPVALLRAAADAARCAGLVAILAECWGNPRILDLTATRRLALAAEQSGVAVLLLRIDAQAMPSAADTRWQVAAAPSVALDANAPGHTALSVELQRQRMGAGGHAWRVEWDRDRCIFREPALSGALVPLPQRGSAAAAAERLLRTA
ncbi:protein ImuA [Sphingomonas laterariae]|uniref:Protein ImuA n=1 Tax=Edaphosphingomonas laterariae TaxID=861865 RepID=A0A239E9K1_9SPHN|nr:hypothetical protein [Sphingomonas laterariae]SNS41297.1 protein ImuA [Sphingomonas laterariae]